MEKNNSIIDQDLPHEIWSHITSYCTIMDLVVFGQISKRFKEAVRGQIQTHLDRFHKDIESKLEKFDWAAKLRNRDNREFNPVIYDRYFMRPQSRSLNLLGLLLRNKPIQVMGTRYMFQTDWETHDGPIHISIMFPDTQRRYCSTLSAAGYLFMFDMSDSDPFDEIFYWINYIIKEKGATAEHPRHFIIVGFIFPDKKREISTVQAKYFADMMGLHYIEVTSGQPNFMDPVFRFTTELFRNDSDVPYTHKCKVQ